MMFTYNTLTDQVHHALGNDKDRLNIYNGGFSTDGRYAFFSIPNYLSESQDMEGGINLRVVSREAVAEEPAWNLRVMDLGTFKLDCLTTGGFRSQSYLTGRVDAPRWSPDNQRIAFVHSKESFFADRLHNECDGLYVYDLDKKTYWRPTDKWMQEQPIGWAPDSKRILLRKMRHFDFPPERETRPEGIYWVNVDTREEKQIGGPTSDARDTCWSPDGRHIFLLTRDEKSNSHILEIVRADDPTDRIEVKRIPIKEGDKMNFIRGLSWLDPNLKQSERTERYDIMEVSQ
jgi:Tol biopolymer transport system component